MSAPTEPKTSKLNTVGVPWGVPESWHDLPIAEVLQRLETDPARGLETKEAARRLEGLGPNELPETESRSPVRILWDQFRATMVMLLIVAGLISLALQDYKDAVAIFAIVILNAAFGFAQEFRAEKAMQALRRLAAPMVKVRRDGSARIAVCGKRFTSRPMKRP